MAGELSRGHEVRNSFEVQDADRPHPAHADQASSAQLATDDWPFLYVSDRAAE
jgi:hypothetical protein